MGNTHIKMIKNKLVYKGVNYYLLAFALAIWSSIFVHLNSFGQVADSAKQVIPVMVTRSQTSSTPLQILSREELERLNIKDEVLTHQKFITDGTEGSIMFRLEHCIASIKLLEKRSGQFRSEIHLVSWFVCINKSAI